MESKVDDSMIRRLLEAIGANPTRSNHTAVMVGAQQLLSSNEDISIESLVASIISCVPCLGSAPCEPLRGLSEEDIIDVVRFYLTCDFEIFFDCPTFRVLIQFRMVQGEWPQTLEAFGLYIRNLIRMSLDPEEFHRENKVNIGVKELSIIKNLYDIPLENDSCAICQEQLTAVQYVLRLKCGHAFHIPEDEEQLCLGAGAGIMRWMSTNTNCPICRQEIQMTCINNFHQKKRRQLDRKSLTNDSNGPIAKKRKA